MAAHHGSTPAAWTIVTITIAGFFVGGLALVLGSSVGVVVAAGIVVAGAIIGKVMQLMGLGKQVTHAERASTTGGSEGLTGLAEPERAG
ncbi:MAG: hypothetical protein GEV03_02330 [Streptosporangiales bacterium]|nr:hypothetical protein [Streptosporangiales bacterium]